ncbi:MAG TPA: flagellar biosynthesis protein FliQ [Spirochaetota bacterium]|nr:flagellar biosynthesis protein FliQ [Spirochaetota bacterium]HOM38831.1 flagellar biosynthesis protein FliQ [Spirochaetota bacterium]HPQ49889.1 flagellar biosynthesis protein FliQ [Spirochaetota bacterium]
MDQGEISFLLGRFIIETLILSSPILIVAIVVGLIVAIFQATTSIQEQTISFAPKLFAIFLVIIIGGGWMLTRLKEFTIFIFSSIAK